MRDPDAPAAPHLRGILQGKRELETPPGFFSPGRPCLRHHMQCNLTRMGVTTPPLHFPCLVPIPGLDRRATAVAAAQPSALGATTGAAGRREARELPDGGEASIGRGNPSSGPRPGQRKLIRRMRPRPVFFPFRSRVPSMWRAARGTGMTAVLDVTAVYFCFPRWSSTLRLKEASGHGEPRKGRGPQESLRGTGCVPAQRRQPILARFPRLDLQQAHSSRRRISNTPAEGTELGPVPNSRLALAGSAVRRRWIR